MNTNIKRSLFLISVSLISITVTTKHSLADDDFDITLIMAGIIASLNSNSSDSEPENSDSEPESSDDIYDAFGANVTVVIDGDEIVFETTGKPDHTSAYWDPDGTSGLYVDLDPSITTESQMSPGFIDESNATYRLRVPISPSKASTTSATSLGAVGIAVSGAPIFNDQEGPNRNLDSGVISGFDRNGAHTGPENYHYHLEPRSISYDDDAVIGIIADGFYLYGRKCDSTGTYPISLDDSGGHTSTTQYNNTAHYHYHIKDELYLSEYYLLFSGDYQGTPNTIN